MLRYENRSQSAGNKKWVSAAAAADFGDSQALWVPPKVPYAYGIAVGSASLHNRSASPVHAGLGARYPVSAWQAGQVTAAGAFTDDTVDAQDAGTDDFAMHSGADSGSGFLIASAVPFNAVGVIQGVAGDQTTPTKIVEYWDGVAWQNIVASALIEDNFITGTGEKLLVFPMPADWAKGGSGTGVPQTTYNLRIRHTNGGAGTTTPQASQIFIGQAKMQVEALASNAFNSLIREHEYCFERVAEALFPIFSAADRSHTVEADVRAY
jgi:hypothetical protein